MRPIGMHGPGEAYVVDDVGPIRRAVTDKANKSPLRLENQPEESMPCFETR